MKTIVIIPKLPKMSKAKRRKWFLMNFGSATSNSPYVIFLEK